MATDLNTGFANATVSEAATRRSVIVDLWRAVFDRRWIVLGIILVCLLIGFVATLLTPARYAAFTRVEISRAEDRVTKVDSVREEGVGQSLEFYQTQYALLKTRSLAERVAKALNLSSNAQFFEAMGSSIADEGTSGKLSASADREARLKSATDILVKAVKINPIRGSSLVDVGIETRDPDLSTRIANEWARQFVAATLDRRFASTADARKFLEDRLSQLRFKLEDSERRLVLYGTNKGIVELTARQDQNGRTTAERTLVTSDLEAISAALTEATGRRIAAESALKAGAQRVDPSAGGALSTLREVRAQASAEYARLRSQFESDYPTVKAAKAKLDELDRSIAAESGRTQREVQTAYDQARTAEEQLLAKLNRLRGSYNTQRGDSIEYEILRREVDTSRQLYDGLLQRYKEIGVAGVGTSNIFIVDPARRPTEKSSPSIPLYMALALLAGIVIAVGFVYISTQIDAKVRDPEQVRTDLELPVLGQIPYFGDGVIEDQLDDRKSMIYEAYLSASTNLGFLTAHGVPRSIMLTSTVPNEGKSISAFAIARMLNQTGRSAIIIDADMRSPTLHKQLGIANDRGLSNFLVGEDDLSRLIVPTGVGSAMAMVAGPTPPNAAEILSTQRMTELIAKLLTTYQHVVIDAPPVLGLADALLLSRSVEGVVYTIEANRSRLREIGLAVDRLRAANATIYGAIVTKLTARNAAYGYGADYGYGYGYGAAGGEDRTAAK